MLIVERKPKFFSKCIVLLFSLLFLFLQSCSSINVIPDQLFDEISTYEYGQSRSELTEFSQLVDSASQSEENRAIAEENILDFLKTDATFASKQYVCRELRIIGSDKSIPVLTDMLVDDKTTNIARYALENIPGNKVDETLIELLPQASKKVKLGIINTLAVRRSDKSVSAIGNLINSDDPDISIAAASALGKIANEECAQYLSKYFKTSNVTLNNIVLDSYLSCADELANQNKMTKANSIYADLYKQNISFTIKQAALVGIINSSSDKIKEILNRIINEPNELKFIPISKIRELPADKDLTDFAKLLPDLEPDNQIQLLGVFEDRRDKNVKPFVLESLNSSIKEVRIASIRTLGNIGDETDVIKLATIAANEKGDEKSYARSALYLLQGNKVNQTIVSNISISEENVRTELIKAVGTRNIKTAFSDIVEYAKSDDSKTRTETFKSLAEISSSENLPSLINILTAQKNNSDRNNVERTISNVLVNFPNENDSELLIKTFQSNTDIDNKCSLLRLLGSTNETKSLQILREELNTNDEQIQLAAIYGLSNWSTPEPLNDLMNIMMTAENVEVKGSALKGFTEFIALDNNLTNEQKVELYKKSLQFANTGNERNIALDGIGNIDCFESLETLKFYVNQPDVKQTVDDGINRVSWHLFPSDPQRVKVLVLEFLSLIKDDRFQTKNKQLIDAIDKYIKNNEVK